MNLLLILVLIAFGLIFVPPASADPSHNVCPHKENGYPCASVLAFSAFVRRFTYKEVGQDGNILNQEKGNIPGISANLALSVAEPIKLTLGAYTADRTVDYNGLTNLGNLFSTKSKAGFRGFSLVVSSPLTVWDERLPASSLYFEVDWNQWRRRIQTTGRIQGLDEQYRWHTLGVGVQGKVWQHDDLSLSLDGEVFRVVTPSVKVDFTQYQWGYPKLKMKGKNGGRLTLRATWRWTERVYVFTTLFREDWSFGASSVRRIGESLVPARIREPESESRILHWGLGLRAQL